MIYMGVYSCMYVLGIGIVNLRNERFILKI